jgi:hypothetical protein
MFYNRTLLLKVLLPFLELEEVDASLTGIIFPGDLAMCLESTRAQRNL